MSERIAMWIQHFCRVPAGLRKGDRVILFEEHIKTIREIYDAPGYDPSKLIGMRGELALYLALVHLAGPMLGKQFDGVFPADIDTLWDATSPELQALLQQQGKRLTAPVDEGPQAA
jgi:hypothetical protein